MSDLYTGTYNYVAFTVNEKRTDSYDENSNGQTFNMNYALQAETAVDLDTARAMASAFVGAQNLYSREGNPISRFSIEHDNEEDLDLYWSFALEWATPSSSSGGPSLSPWPREEYTENETWSTDGGTAHITEAVGGSGSGSGTQYGETVTQVDPSDPGPTTFYGRIGWNGESAEGVDVVRPSYSFTLQKRLSDAELETAVAGSADYFGSALTYRQLRVAMTGSVNSDAFRGWSAGNVLFEGVSSTPSVEYDDGNPQSDGSGGYIIPYVLYHTITFKFRCNFSRTGMPVAGASVNKEGFQYLWVYSKKQDDSVTGVTLEYPQTVVVNDVYDKLPFSLLGF